MNIDVGIWLRVCANESPTPIAHFYVAVLQVDVIEAGYSQLQLRIAAAQNFESAATAHQAYVDALVMQSFMDLPNFNKLLMLVLALCTRLCTLLKVIPNSAQTLTTFVVKSQGRYLRDWIRVFAVFTVLLLISGFRFLYART